MPPKLPRLGPTGSLVERVSGADQPAACPAGTYRSMQVAASSSDCAICPEGSACVTGACGVWWLCS